MTTKKCYELRNGDQFIPHRYFKPVLDEDEAQVENSAFRYFCAPISIQQYLNQRLASVGSHTILMTYFISLNSRIKVFFVRLFKAVRLSLWKHPNFFFFFITVTGSDIFVKKLFMQLNR